MEETIRILIQWEWREFIYGSDFRGRRRSQVGGMIDWNIPLLSRFELSGELFAGKGLDGFGAAPAPVVAQTDYTEYITYSAAALAHIPSFGGWSQLKFRINSRDEINLALGGVGRK